MNSRKHLVFIVWLGFLWLLPVAGRADAHYAASCSYSDVSAACSAASNGDIVLIPAGSATWSSTLRITKQLSIQGAGKTQTIITNGGVDPMIEISLAADLPVEIMGVQLRGSSCSQGGYKIYIKADRSGKFALSKLRIHHNRFDKGNSAAIVAHGWVESLIDYNDFINHNIGILILGDNQYSWSRPLVPGTENALFIENNSFVIDANWDAGHGPNESIYHQEGGRTVVRYNTHDGTAQKSYAVVFYDSHGNQANYPDQTFRGQPLLEAYANTSHVYNCGSLYMFHIRGGSVLIYDNDFTVDSGNNGDLVRLTEDESGTWPLQDQANNCFIWGNSIQGRVSAHIYIPSGKTSLIQENRDYFTHQPQSTGGRETYTSWVGGPMTFSASGANAYYPYTAYVYPHPLSGEGAIPPRAPTGLRILY